MTRALMCFLICTFSASAAAQDWRERYPELVFAAAPVENSTEAADRYAPFLAYLSRELEVKVRLQIVSDYSAIIEAQRAGNVQIAHYGPSSYARARLVTNQGVEVFATFVPADGTRGLYPALYVRAAEPATSVQELKGKNLCLVDPNSTTGNDGPRFYLSKLGIDPGSFFAKVVYAGSHENAVIALQRGTCDAAFTWWGSDQDSMVARMAKKGLVKSDEFRMIAKADIIPTPPIAYLSSLPIDLKHSIQAAFVDAYRKDRAAVDQLWDGQFAGFRAASDEDYAASVDLLRFVDQLHHSR